MDEKPFSPLFSVCVCVWGEWLQMTGNPPNKDEILDNVLVNFTSFISPILYKIIKEAKHKPTRYIRSPIHPLAHKWEKDILF